MNIVGALSHVDSVDRIEAGSPAMAGASGLAALTSGGATWVYAAGQYGDGVQVLSFAPDGTLTPGGAVTKLDGFPLDGPVSIDVLPSGGAQYLLVPAFWNNAVSVFRLATEGEGAGLPTYVTSVVDSVDVRLENPIEVQGFVTRQGSFMAVLSGPGLTTWRIDAAGQPSFVASLGGRLDPEPRLQSMEHIEFTRIGGQLFGYVIDDNEIVVLSLSETGVPSEVTRITVPTGQYNGIWHQSLGTFSGQRTLVLTDSIPDDAHVYRIGADGVPVLAATTHLPSVSTDAHDAWIVTVGGVDFVAIPTAARNSMALYDIAEDGTLRLVVSAVDSADLDGASAVMPLSVGGREYLVTALSDGDGVATWEVGAADDVLVGTDEADRITGLGGNDDLTGLQGADTILGGAGNDTLSGRVGADLLLGGQGADLLAGGSGDDTLEGGAGADVLLGEDGTDLLSYAASQGAVRVSLAAGTAEGGHATGDTFAGIEGVAGSAFGDVLTGDAVANALYGGTGADSLDGGDGDDRLFGGRGFDILRGGAGNDLMTLGDGSDRALGGLGDDTILGNNGRDFLFGYDGNDRLEGHKYLDVLDGGAGDDTLVGGTHSDEFRFNGDFGADVIADFEVGLDKINLSGVSSMSSYADVQAGTFTIGGEAHILVAGGNSIQLKGVAPAELSADDFLF